MEISNKGKKPPWGVFLCLIFKEREGTLTIELASLRATKEMELEDPVIFQMGKDKAPNLDDFSITFYQECWDIIKEDLLKFFYEFLDNGIQLSLL